MGGAGHRPRAKSGSSRGIEDSLRPRSPPKCPWRSRTGTPCGTARTPGSWCSDGHLAGSRGRDIKFKDTARGTSPGCPAKPTGTRQTAEPTGASSPRRQAPAVREITQGTPSSQTHRPVTPCMERAPARDGCDGRPTWCARTPSRLPRSRAPSKEQLLPWAHKLCRLRPPAARPGAPGWTPGRHDCPR